MSDVLQPSGIQASRFGSHWVWTDGSLDPQAALSVLLQADGDSGLTKIGNRGRGSAWRLTVNGEPAVLRHYQRGGLMARMNRDRYLWQGALQTRAYREFDLMLRLSDRGLPVPRPIAARASRHGLSYRAAILTRYVEHRGALSDLPHQAAWHAAGAAIARLHAAGVWHADLNVHNILIDADNRAWLIDFDRAQEGVSDRSRLQDNLSRLLRSVRKVCPELIEPLWPVLLDGYADTQKIP